MTKQQTQRKTFKDEKFYTIKQACELSQISRKTLWKLRRDKKLGFVETGRNPKIAQSHINPYLSKLGHPTTDRDFLTSNIDNKVQ
jgi:excisionase family DNA binding protein